MTVKEKAKELVDKFYEYSDGTGSCERFYDDLAIENAKKCAIICVENEYNSLRTMILDMKTNRVTDPAKYYFNRITALNNEEVRIKKEIEKL